MEKVNYDEIRYKGNTHYTSERNTQIVLSLLKSYGIRQVVASPGATNFAVVGSMQHDKYFKMYSCVDERAAAYMAIGIAESTGEPVVLSCTGATASRNYMAALTQAFEKKLPILVVTSSLTHLVSGHLRAQMTDRDHAPIDMVASQYCLPIIHNGDILEEWNCTIKVNQALADLIKYKKGPVHLNVCASYSMDFSVTELPPAKRIQLYFDGDKLPSVPNGRIGIFIGSHHLFDKELTKAIEDFCSSYNGVVFCDHTSGYHGKYKVMMSLPFFQSEYTSKCKNIDLLVHLGEISGDYYSLDGLKPKTVWRVNEDGNFVDYLYKLSSVFKMSELAFFRNFPTKNSNCSYYEECKKEYETAYSQIPEVPFSNIWIAKQLHNQIPSGSQIHFAILNSLRAWNFFWLPENVESRSNVGGFGIDGCVSSMIGAALCNPERNYYGVFGDLATFYDINVFLLKDFPQNVRIIVVNNGRGTEFRNYSHTAFRALGKTVDAFVAAAGHFGCDAQSPLSSVCNEVGVTYVPIRSKADFVNNTSNFLSLDVNTPMLFEVFTDSDDESIALKMMSTILRDPISIRGLIGKAKKRLRGMLRSIVNKIKR